MSTVTEMLSPVQLDILNFLANGPASSHDIKMCLFLGRETCRTNLKKLIEAGKIEKAIYLVESKDGKLIEKPCYRLTKEAA